MTLVKSTDLTLTPPRIPAARFKEILQKHRSPALGEADVIYRLLINGGVDPSFMLGQFLVESLYGTAGHAIVTKSVGNILWDAAWTPDVPKYSPGNGYTYAKYPNWTEGAADYVEYVNRYAVTADYRYGDTCETIDKATARWTGASLTEPGHLRYVSILINAINSEYEYVPGVATEEGDIMIFAPDSAAIDSKYRYPVKNGTALYRGTSGDLLKYASFGDGRPSTTGNCKFFGPAGQPWSDAKWAWGTVLVGIGGVYRLCYIKEPIKTSVAKI